MEHRFPYRCRSRLSGASLALTLSMALLGGCAHQLAITSDPPGQPVRFNDVPVGTTPVVVEERTPYAMHRVQVGEGPDAVTQVVAANRPFARTEIATGLVPAMTFLLLPWAAPVVAVTGMEVLFPLVATSFLLPSLFTAGTVDRVHVARSLSGESLGPLPDAAVELEYLPPDRRYPAGVHVASQVVEGQRVRVMVERRRFAFSLYILEFSERGAFLGDARIPTGAELEWLPEPRWSVGLNASHRFTEERLNAGYHGIFGDMLVVREQRLGLFGRYRLPLLRWDGTTGGLDAPFALGAELMGRQVSVGPDTQYELAYQPYVEGGLDIQFTPATVLFSALRYYHPLQVKEYFPPLEQGKLTFGIRFLY